MRKLLDVVERCYRSFCKRVPTGAPTASLKASSSATRPRCIFGRPIRLYYITQAESRPPTFVVQVNHPEGMHYSYRRYLQNQLRQTFELEGTPVRPSPANALPQLAVRHAIHHLASSPRSRASGQDYRRESPRSRSGRAAKVFPQRLRIARRY